MEQDERASSEESATRRSRRRFPSILALLALGLVVFMFSRSPPKPFARGFSNTLAEICDTEALGGAGGAIGPNLSAICFAQVSSGAFGATVSSTASGLSAQTPDTLAIEERLQSIREAEEEKPEGGASSGLYAVDRREGRASDLAELQLPPTRSGPSPGIVIGRTDAFGAQYHHFRLNAIGHAILR